MLKRIRVEDLSCGMFLHEVCGSWIEHPFWRSSFLVRDPADIARLREHGISEVWIDTTRGSDVATTTLDIAGDATPPAEPVCAAADFSACPGRATLAEEFARAAAICGDARRVVENLFAEVRLGKAADAAKLLPVIDDVIASVRRHPCALISLARMKAADDCTYEHSVAVCALLAALGNQFELAPEVLREVALGGLLHDIGKVELPPELLCKPEPLDAAELAAIRAHPASGERILAAGRGIGEIVREICLHHHERRDGSGYPDRQRRDAISRYAMMAAVCDTYDALTADRQQDSGRNPAAAISRMAAWSDSQFDQTIFRAFVKSVGIYPSGSLVRLRSGNLALVLEQSPQSLLKPTVKMYYSTADRASLQSKRVDLADPAVDDAVVSIEDPRDWSLGDLNQLWRLDAAAPID